MPSPLQSVSGKVTGSGTTTLSVALTATQAGSCLVAYVAAFGDASSPTTVTLTSGTGGTGGTFAAGNWAVASASLGTAAMDAGIWADPSAATGTNAVKVTTNGTGVQSLMVIVEEWPGLVPSAVTDATATPLRQTVQASSWSVGPTGTTAQANEVVVACAAAFNLAGASPSLAPPGAPWTEETQVTQTSAGNFPQALAAGYQVVSSTGTFTYAGTDLYKTTACIATLKVAAVTAVSSSDTAAGTDAGTVIRLSGSDAASAADAAEHVAGPVPSKFTGLLALASLPPSGPAASAETAHGADAGEAVTARLSSAETAQGAEAGQALAGAVSAETAQGAESPGTVTARLSSAETGHGTDAGEFVSTGPHVSDADAVHAEDSGFAVIASAEPASGTDGGESVLVVPAVPETALGAERELRSWPADSDSAAVAEDGYWSGPVRDAETASAAEAAVSVALSDSGVFPRGDSCLVTDAAGPGSGQVRVYAFQPPFRWTGGGFALRFGGKVVWTGHQPDAAAYELWRQLDGTDARLVTDADSASAAEEHDPALVSASVTVRPAVAVTVAVSRW